MIVVLQRVKEASVVVEGRTVGEIGCGLCLLVGVEKGDGEERGLHVETGVFGALMEVRIINDGPVTFIIQKNPETS
ncbi:MAG: D-aminoacyl-tRNA deacylase [Acidobacteria bacterium]|nr:D-aminoacyl-tRNA deacylase [Acidobacteriota bacterium]MBU4330715.1 D-aminoacyl-tRNA deacylase [Acidobacteriota bacterium]MBU4495918.1 D-aminoacyl-tRNA deacylase [Acidobacteriota bacterium]MCG2815432.1 D-aminoacyl-tRNA deacylase [Candidatus Aminicenantes bacterium]